MTAAIKETVEQQQYLTFLLADEEYAISILKVKEIIEYTAITKVPKVPSWIRGVINLRGAVVPVIDLAVKFGLEEKPVSKTTCVVIVESQFEGQTTMMGAIADAVSQVMDLTAQDIQPVPEFGTRLKVTYLLGMAQLGKKFALLLDVDKVLSTDELLNLNEVSTLAETLDTLDSASPALAPDAEDALESPEQQSKQDQ